MESITFSPAQIHVFNMVSHITSKKALEELREQLAAFYAKQVTYSGRYPFSIPVIPVHFFVSKDRYLLRS